MLKGFLVFAELSQYFQIKTRRKRRHYLSTPPKPSSSAPIIGSIGKPQNTSAGYLLIPIVLKQTSRRLFNTFYGTRHSNLKTPNNKYYRPRTITRVTTSTGIR